MLTVMLVLVIIVFAGGALAICYDTIFKDTLPRSRSPHE